MYCALTNFRCASASSQCFVCNAAAKLCSAIFSSWRLCLNADSFGSLVSCVDDAITIFRPNSFDNKLMSPSIFSFNLKTIRIIFHYLIGNHRSQNLLTYCIFSTGIDIQWSTSDRRHCAFESGSHSSSHRVVGKTFSVVLDHLWATQNHVESRENFR